MKKKIKRVFSLWLACLILLFCPVNAYAGVQSPSDADEEPFYYDENGNKIYDSDIDWSQYRTESNYDDILWTFEEYPETMMTNGDMDTYVVGVDDAIIIAIVSFALAICGYSISKSDIPEFISKGFEPWLRRNKGGNSAVMSMWQSLFKTTFGTAFVGMKLLVQNISEYLQSLSITDTTITIPVNSSVGMKPVIPNEINSSESYSFLGGSYFLGSEKTSYYDIYMVKSAFESVVCAYVSYTPSADDIYANDYFTLSYQGGSNYGLSGITSVYITNDYLSSGYWEKTGALIPVNITSRNQARGLILKSHIFSYDFPVFANYTAADSWYKYGTIGGLLNGDTDTLLSINTANQWMDLKQDFLTRWAISDTLNIPNTQEALDSLVDSLSKAQTGTDVITNLNTVWTITDAGSGDIGITPTVAYSNLCYVLSALAGYAGATLTDEQKDSFITSFYTGNIDGTAALVDEQAQAIVRNFVVINGGSQSPNDNNDNNKYKVLKKLAVSLGAFLVSAGLVSDAPSYDNEPSVSNNVQVVEKQSPDVPTPSPDTGTDLSGVLGYLKQFLDILLTWANPLSLMDSLISKLGLPTISDGIKAAIKTLPKLISGELTLPELFGNVTDAIFSMPQQVADAIARALGMENGFPDILGEIKHVGDVIVSIPGQITSFFSVDMIAVGNSFDGVQSALVSRFEVVTSIGKIFDGLSFSGDETIPVITMRVPDTIAEVLGQNEVVVFDLRGYESYCQLIRNIFRCFMWIGFAFAVMRMFDIEFHVG